jgi:hypothetical protein
MSEPLFEWAEGRVACEVCEGLFDPGLMALMDVTRDGLSKVWLCADCLEVARATVLAWRAERKTKEG